MHSVRHTPISYSRPVACTASISDIQKSTQNSPLDAPYSSDTRFLSNSGAELSARSFPQLGVISRGERRFILFVACILCVASSIPYVEGYLVPASGQAFTGILVHDADTYNYLAYANQSAAGKWLFHNPMTGEPHRDVLFNLEWLAIGKISSRLHVSLPSAMNIVRVMAITLMCYGVYWLSTFLLENVLTRRLALLATMAGGGFGWIVAVHLLHVRLDSSYFLDISVANFFPFHWALKLPHFLVAQSFATLGLCFFIRAEVHNQTRDYVYAGLCYLAAGACRPYDMVYLITATGSYLALGYGWKAERAGQNVLVRSAPILMCLPLLGYYYWIFKIHPVFEWWRQPGCPAPPVWQLALSYGTSLLLLPFALWFLFQKPINKATLFMVCCLGTSLLLIHLHGVLSFPFQFSTASLVPLVMVVLAGLQMRITAWRNGSRWATVVIAAVLFVNSLTSIALLAQAVVQVAKADFRIDQNLKTAFVWLNEHSRPDDLVFADFNLSNQLPSYTHNRVFYGYLNTVKATDKAKEMKEFFFANGRENSRKEMLHREGIQFVLLTPEEEHIIDAGNVPTYLREVFRNEATAVFVPNFNDGTVNRVRERIRE